MYMGLNQGRLNQGNPVSRMLPALVVCVHLTHKLEAFRLYSRSIRRFLRQVYVASYAPSIWHLTATSCLNHLFRLGKQGRGRGS